MSLKMKPRYSLIVAFVIAVPLVLLVLNTADSGSPGIIPTATPTSDSANGQVERGGEPVETNTHLMATPEAAETMTMPESDGTTLLQTYCAQCHSVKLLEKTRMSRANWEKTLSRMERYSDLTSDAEKLLVLEHLTAPDKP